MGGSGWAESRRRQWYGWRVTHTPSAIAASPGPTSRTRMSSSTNSPGRGWGRHRIIGSYIFEFDFRPPVSSPFFLPSVPPFHPSVLLSLKRHTLFSLKRRASRLRRMFKTLQTNPYWFCLGDKRYLAYFQISNGHSPQPRYCGYSNVSSKVDSG